MEGPRGDEEDEVGVDVAVLGADGAALDQGQQVTLHTLRTSVRTTVVAYRTWEGGEVRTGSLWLLWVWLWFVVRFYPAVLSCVVWCSVV